MKTIQLIIMVLLSTGFVNVFAQEHDHAHDEHTVRGKVTDEQNKALVGALIYWGHNHRETVITDKNGEFKIHKHHNGDYLYANYVGYAPDSTIINEHDHYVVFKLQAGIELDEVVVSHREKTTVSSSLKPIHTLEIAESELHKAACCNLSESFETTPLVDVTFTDAITGTKQIQMLGLSGSYVQFTRENIPAIRGLATMYGLQFIPGTWIREIHLNKGTGSVINGFESITGQIDIQLHEPKDIESVYVNLFGSESGRAEFNVHAKKDISDSWSTAVLLHGRTQNTRHDNNDDNFLDMPLGNQLIGINRWEYHGADDMHVQFGIKGTYLSQIGGEQDYSPSQIHNITNPWGMNTYITRGDTWMKIGKTYTDKLWESIGFQSAFSFHNQESQYGLQTYTGDELSGYANLIFQGASESEQHQYNTGLSFQYDRVDETFNNQPFSYEESVPGMFGEHTYIPGEKITFVTGIRGDYHSIYGGFITPHFHVRYKPNSNYVIRLSTGRGQRTARVFAENANLMASSRLFLIHSENNESPYGLEPEIAWNVGANITRYFSLWNRKGSLTLDAYRTQFQEQVIIDFVQDQYEVHIYNLDGTSFSNSMQAQIDYELIHNLDIRMAYRWYDVQSTYNGELQKKPFVSEHRAFTNLAYTTESDWSFDYTVQWHGSKYAPLALSSMEQIDTDTQSPDFFTMNAQVTKTWNDKLDIYVGSENLLNYVQENPIFSASQPYSSEFDASQIWGPVFGREVYAGLRYTF
ncbi:MAG: TonB-dependent receptor [Bacteroidota bacterium]